MNAVQTRWVACSIEADVMAARDRHLITPNSLTTLCGCTATHPEVWRGNTTKPKCVDCEKRRAAMSR